MEEPRDTDLHCISDPSIMPTLGIDFGPGMHRIVMRRFFGRFSLGLGERRALPVETLFTPVI